MSELFAESEREGQPLELDIDKSIDRLSDKDNGEESPSDSQSEKDQTEKEPSEEGELEKDNTPPENIPFHKHPRWIKMQQERDEDKKRLADFETKFKDVDPSKLKGNESEIELPKWWTDTYKDTSESRIAYRNYQTATQAERERIESQVEKNILTKIEAREQESQKGEEYVNEALDELETENKNFNRNELLKFMVDFQDEFGPGSLLDNEGNYDFRKALSLKERFQPVENDNSLDERKRLASDTMTSKGKSLSNSSIPRVSLNTLRRGNWRDVE